jgi:hypothetical protein
VVARIGVLLVEALAAKVEMGCLDGLLTWLLWPGKRDKHRRVGASAARLSPCRPQDLGLVDSWSSSQHSERVRTTCLLDVAP